MTDPNVYSTRLVAYLSARAMIRGKASQDLPRIYLDIAGPGPDEYDKAEEQRRSMNISRLNQMKKPNAYQNGMIGTKRKSPPQEQNLTTEKTAKRNKLTDIHRIAELDFRLF